MPDDNDNRALPTADKRFPGKTVSLQSPRSYNVPGGPYARSLGKTEVKVMSEFTRGGPRDRAR